jgi:hypothetical protein
MHGQFRDMYTPHLHLTPYRAPYMVDSILLTDLLGVIQRRGAVAICDNEYVLSWEDFQGCLKRGTDELRGLVLQICCVSVRSSRAPQFLARCTNGAY